MPRFDLSNAVRPNIWTLEPYSCARDEFQGTADVFLDANENAFGPVVDAEVKALPASSSSINPVLHRYPDPRYPELRQRIANFRHVKPGNVFLGVGSDEVIDLIIRIFCVPGREAVVITPPTYGMYKVSAAVNDVEVISVPLVPEGSTFQLNVDGILSACQSRPVKVIFLCSPNNPTGNDLEIASMERVLQESGTVVVVDEAYIDFTESPSASRWVDTYPNLIVMQTFSKSFGLAAIRLGVAIASTSIIDILNKVKAPYNISELTVAAGVEAMENANEMRKKVTLIKEQRLRLINAFGRLPAVKKIFHSDSNFILVRLDNALDVYHRLVDAGIVTRYRGTQLLCDNCIRFTVGTAPENEKLIAALKEITGAN
eukprot:TRINITY_DN11897_c0_g1_i2.p2 TRINITY_DN11897_c0_g1~~TRINITY_DN11897_c0_g1_i2.p2  ORF type:complete len:379 (+),score=69.27 TRINITY_DN11897_c0_g1_i2:23-1138(+)